MKKAVIVTGGKQHLVSEGEILEIERLNQDGTSLVFTPLLVVDGEKTIIGTPELSDIKVTAEIIDSEIKAEKVVAIRYKSKKRVHKLQGHRQHLTRIKITTIT